MLKRRTSNLAGIYADTV